MFALSWIQPVGFILVAKIAFLRPQYWRYYDKTSYYFPLLDKSSHRKFNEFRDDNVFQFRALQRYILDEHTWFWKGKSKVRYENYEGYSGTPLKLLFWSIVSKVDFLRVVLLKFMAFITMCCQMLFLTFFATIIYWKP